MMKKEAEKKQVVLDDGQYSRQLEKKIEELRKANEETIRLKNVEKFSATGRMARAIAHEIRNPLTNISLASEQLSAEIPHNDDISLLIGMINRNTMRINHLITELLDSTKFAQLSFSHASVNLLFDEILEQQMLFAEQKNVQIEKRFSSDLPELYVDVEKIKTALENLVTNAIESVSPNEGRIVITTANENNKCVVTIQSNGEAISEEKIERLFEPHFTSKKGSGLALTQTQNIVLNHGGSIYVESETGKGTTFTIVLDFA